MAKDDIINHPETMELLPVNNRDAMIEIAELKRQVAEIQNRKGPVKLGNPAVVGLAGFGLTTLVLQFHNIGWLESAGPVIWLGLIFGGLAQMIAGLQEYANGNNFGYSAFTTYGAFWIALALMMIGNHFKIATANAEAVGFFLVGFTLYTLIMTVGSFCISIALFIVFFLLFLGFVLLDICHFDESQKWAKLTAGWVLLFCALGAWYVMAHIIYQDSFKWNVLPVGPPPIELVRSYLDKRRDRLPV